MLPVSKLYSQMNFLGTIKFETVTFTCVYYCFYNCFEEILSHKIFSITPNQVYSYQRDCQSVIKYLSLSSFTKGRRYNINLDLLMFILHCLVSWKINAVFLCISKGCCSNAVNLYSTLEMLFSIPLVHFDRLSRRAWTNG